MTSLSTPRDRAKAERTDALLDAAARLFARSGYNGASLEEIGATAGVSGPAVYRHFNGKQALLGGVLVKVSEDLLAGGTAVVQAETDAARQLAALVRFHTEFALGNPDVIRVQGQDVAHLSSDDRAAVRRLQRDYIALWSTSLAAVQDGEPDELRLRVQACFGLLNSTPHSTTSAARARAATAQVLCTMALAALRAPVS